MLSETKVSSLRLEVDKLRAEYNKVRALKDDETSYDEASMWVCY